MNPRHLRDFLSNQPTFISISIFVVVLLILQVSVLAQSSSNELSKEKLVALKKAGLSDSVLIEQIRKDGIGFDVNADTTLELKTAGFSNEVLQALLQAGSKAPSAPSAQPARDDSVAGLYKAGRFPELADRLKVTLKANPSDYKTHALLIMTLLKMKENEAAHAEFQQLEAHENDPAAAPYVKQVKELFDLLEATNEAKQKLIAAVKDDRAADAYAGVDHLRASTVQKDILKIDLDLYQGKFDQARDRFSKVPFSSFSEKERSAKILENIGTTEAAYKKLISRIEVYLHSTWTPVLCRFPISSAIESAAYYPQYTEDFKQLASMSSNEYAALVGDLGRLVPLNDDARNLSFHAVMLGGDYEKLELLGDKLLKDRGSIRIPFFGRDQYFQLIIDSDKKRIYTEADPHPFQFKFPSKYIEGYWAEWVPFDLRFDQITGLSQRAGHWRVGISSMSDLIVQKSYALKFEPNGVAPNYALMNILFCSAGEKAELTVTRNLGQYILHVIGNNSIKVELADPSKAAGAPNGLLTGLMIAGASMSSNPGVRDAATQGLLTDQAQQIANYQGQQVAWESFTTQDTFNFVEADAFTGLEQLLGVLN